MVTKLMQEAVTDVASCGVMNLPTTWIFLIGSLMILAKAAYTANLYTMTPIIQATIREICKEHKCDVKLLAACDSSYIKHTQLQI